jgi:hypothetical protein
MTAKSKEQITAVISHFADRGMAERYVQTLKHAGFQDDEIGMIAAHEEDTPLEEGAVAGAITGGALGAAAGAAAVGVIPGVGPVLAVGILTGVLGGATAGATAGSLVGALIGAGVPEGEASKYEKEFLAGRTIVIVQALGRGGEAIGILRDLERDVAAASKPTLAGKAPTDRPPLTAPEDAGRPYATKP